MKALTTAALASILAAAVPTCAIADDIEKIGKIIERSKLTRSIYSIYFWNWIRSPGRSAIEEWSAEFHSGNFHRVETPRDRVVADCHARTGSALSLVTGKIVTGPQVAGMACGINTNRQFLAAESLGRVKGRFGAADRVRLADEENIRTYDISDDGLILRTTYELNNSDRALVLDVETVALVQSLPSQNMFDEASLGMSFVPEKFKSTPGISK